MTTKKIKTGFKTAVFALIITISTSGLCRVLPQQKAKDFLKDKCFFAIGDRIPEFPKSSTEKKALAIGAAGGVVGDLYDLNRGFEVYCVYDGVIRKGTIEEKSGCMATSYDLSKNEYRPFLNTNIYAPEESMVVGSPCSKDIVVKLLSRKMGPVPGKGVTLWEKVIGLKFYSYDLTVPNPIIDTFSVYPTLLEMKNAWELEEKKDDEARKLAEKAEAEAQAKEAAKEAAADAAKAKKRAAKRKKDLEEKKKQENLWQ